MIELLETGRWSGGGLAVNRNILEALSRVRVPPGRPPVAVCARNAVPRRLLASSQPWFYVPQSALPWIDPRWLTTRELARAAALRLASDLALRRASGVVCLSTAIPTPARAPSIVLPNVLDADFEDVLTAAGASAPSGDGAEIVYVGSAAPFRRADDVVRAFSIYRKRGGRRHLTVIAPGRPTDDRDDLPVRTLASAARADVVSAFLRSRVAVFPSAIEASPVSLLEAVACGCTIIATRIAGHVETIGHLGADVHWIEVGDVGALAAGLRAAEDASASGDSIIGTIEGRARERERWVELLRLACEDWLEP